MVRSLVQAVLVLAWASGLPFLEVARAEDPAVIEVSIQDHRFDPAEIRVPAGKAVMLRIHNQDATAEEFDSGALKVEKVIAAGGTGTVRLRPLEKGRYPFVGEYHESTATGAVVVE